MAINKISVDEFVALVPHLPVLDVRSPSEYNHAHIPKAISFPLFTDEERKVVGTTYKQQSREKAIKTGLVYFGPKMVSMVEQAESITSDKTDKRILVHCWRGGMRSAAVAWLLDLYGFEIMVLSGGYKSFRNWALSQFDKNYSWNVLGGYTGSGKTIVLHELVRAGKTVLDLEALASHKGSAFGGINMPAQPSQEMFENLLATQLAQLVNHNAYGKGMWVEDESQRIGSCTIPLALWNQLRTSQLYFLEIDFEKRLQHIISGYGSGEKEKLVNAITRIQKRLGGLETKTAINHLLENDYAESFSILLKYYDKLYAKGLHSRNNTADLVQKIICEEVDPVQIARQLILFASAGVEKA